MIRKILKWPNPILTQVCDRVDVEKPETHVWCDHLLETFASRRDAAGLAAPQIGYPVRIIAAKLDGRPVVMMNPVVEKASSICWSAEESCLSMPWLRVKVSRPHSATISYQNREGHVTLTLYEFEARVVLHEIDHLNGITVDHHRRGLVAAPGKLTAAK